MLLRSSLVALLAISASPVLAQPFDPGPIGSVPGSSMSGMRIVGAPQSSTRGIPNADVFGDTVEERVYGRNYDNSYLTPKVRILNDGDLPIELRATEGRSDLNGVNAGAFARGEGSISRSGVTRGQSRGPQRPIVRRAR